MVTLSGLAPTVVTDPPCQGYKVILGIAMRRLILISGLWLGLFGVAQPLLACAMNPSMLNCCPNGMQMPCHSGSDQGASVPSTGCCATAPSSAISTGVAVESRDTQLAPVTGGHPAGDTTTAAATHWPSPIVDSRSPASRIPILYAASGGAEIYLRTGRLRL